MVCRILMSMCLFGPLELPPDIICARYARKTVCRGQNILGTTHNTPLVTTDSVDVTAGGNSPLPASLWMGSWTPPPFVAPRDTVHRGSRAGQAPEEQPRLFLLHSTQKKRQCCFGQFRYQSLGQGARPAKMLGIQQRCAGRHF